MKQILFPTIGKNVQQSTLSPAMEERSKSVSNRHHPTYRIQIFTIDSPKQDQLTINKTTPYSIYQSLGLNF